jgi:UDP-N-acetylglucosamine 2-epimerase (non-hydrolysing)
LKILNIVGARPNFMKIAPIQREMEKRNNLEPLIIHTGQHYDDKMSKLFFDDLELPRPARYLQIGSDSHARQTARIMIEFEKVVEEERPDLVLVVGDVNSTAACSLVAAKMGIKIAHVEAGLRSFDRTMPEEINRMVTDTLSDYLFVTEKSGLENLRKEGIPDEKIFFTGNVMIDSLVYFLEKAKKSVVLNQLNLSGNDYALVTLHRPSNVDVRENFENLLKAFSEIESDLKIVFPIHPRSRKMLANFGLDIKISAMKNLILLDPIGYLDFMKLMQNAKLVLTDSGGIQEETTYLGIPCITLRENTERPVTIELGTNILVGSDSERVISEAKKIINGQSKRGQVPELWDGKAAERIVSVVEKEGKG